MGRIKLLLKWYDLLGVRNLRAKVFHLTSFDLRVGENDDPDPYTVTETEEDTLSVYILKLSIHCLKYT